MELTLDQVLYQKEHAERYYSHKHSEFVGRIVLLADSSLGIFPYASLISKLNELGFDVAYINIKEKVNYTELQLDLTKHGYLSYILISHLDGYKFVSRFTPHKTIFINPLGPVLELSNRSLFMFSNESKAKKSISDTYGFLKKDKRSRFLAFTHRKDFLWLTIPGCEYAHNVHKKIQKSKKISDFDADLYGKVSDLFVSELLSYINGEMPKKNIAIFTENYLPFTSGVTILMHELRKQMIALGYRPYIVTYRIKGVDYHTESQEENVVTLGASLVPFGKKECLYASFNINGHYHELMPFDFDLVHLNAEYTISRIGLKLSKKQNIPLLYTAHTMWDDMFEKRFIKPIAALAKFFCHHLLFDAPVKRCQIMTVPTIKVADYYRERLAKYVDKKMVILPGSVNQNRFAITEEDKKAILELKKKYDLIGKEVIGYVGRVSKEKSIQDILSYFEQVAPIYPNLRFMVCGDGPYLEEFKKLVEVSPESEKVIIVGMVDNRELKYYYRLFDCFCTASTFETQGLTYLEAMLSGVPILARRDPCLRFFLEHDKNCFLFEEFDTWLTGFNTIFFDEEKRKAYIEGAHHTTRRFTKEAWGKKVAYLYNECTYVHNKADALVYEDDLNKIE